jgi:EmrB/QacA subfamily drug resistance transporter
MNMRKWLPLTAVCAGTFMLLVDVTIVTVALPDMAGGLHASLSALQWVLGLYALVLAALVLSAGSLADRIGRRSVYLGGLTIFGAASLTCGLSGNATVLITARGVQGLAAAAMFATTLALINSSYEGRDRGFAFGVWAAVNGAAAAVGPVLGGLLTSSLGWRWIFLVNLPICLGAIILTLLVVRESRNPDARSVDLPGMVTFSVAAAALVWALIRDSWGSGATIGLLAVSVAALIAFVAVESRRRTAMLDLSLLRIPSFTTLLITAAALPAAAWAYWVYETLWAQSVLGLSPVKAGLLFLPASCTTFVVSLVVGRVMHKKSKSMLIGCGMLFIAAGALAQAVMRTGSGWPVVLPGLFLVGVGAGLVLGPMSAAAMAAVPGPRAGMAAGAVNTFRQLGYAIGVAVFGEVFRTGLSHNVSQSLVGPLSDGRAGSVIAQGADVAHSVHRAYANALDLTFLAAAAFALVAAVAVFIFVRQRPTPTPSPQQQPVAVGARRDK